MRYRPEYYVHFLSHLMEALRLEKASLVGIYMGGAISLGFSLRWSQRVEKLVLVDGYGLGKEVPRWVLSYAMVRLQLLNKVVRPILGRSRMMVRWSLRTVFHDPRAVTSSLVDEVFQGAHKLGVGLAWTTWQSNEIGWSGLHTNYVDRLHTLVVPTLILHGAEDRYVPVSWAQRAHPLIGRSELEIFPRCDH